MRRFTIFMFISVFVCLSSSLYSENIVRIATLTDYPPYCFNKRNTISTPLEIIPPGKDSSYLQGLCWDIVRESYHNQGYTIQLEIVPISRALHYIENGTVDVIFPFVVTSERLTKFNFSRNSIVTNAIVIYLNKNIQLVWKGISTMNGKKVAVIRKWAYGKVWEGQNGIEKIETDSILQCFKMLDNSWVSGVVGYEDAFDYMLRQNAISSNYIKTPSIDTVSNYLLGNSKINDSRKYLDIFDTGNEAIKNNGILKKIITKWE